MDGDFESVRETIRHAAVSAVGAPEAAMAALMRIELRLAAAERERDNTQTELEHWEQEIPRSLKRIETLTDQLAERDQQIAALREAVERAARLHDLNANMLEGLEPTWLPEDHPERASCRERVAAHRKFASDNRALLAPPAAKEGGHDE